MSCITILDLTAHISRGLLSQYNWEKRPQNPDFSLNKSTFINKPENLACLEINYYQNEYGIALYLWISTAGTIWYMYMNDLTDETYRWILNKCILLSKSIVVFEHIRNLKIIWSFICYVCLEFVLHLQSKNCYEKIFILRILFFSSLCS